MKKTSPFPQIIPSSNFDLLPVFEEENADKHLKRLKKKEPRIVFFGNTKYSTIGAQILDQTYPLTLVVTIPDKQTGRQKTLTPSPVKDLAWQLNIPVLEADKLTPDIIEQIAFFKPDFLVVEDYGLILPSALLEIPSYAPLNIHHSLLPKYRGPSPAPSAILAGEKVSGVTVIKMTDKVDAGDILVQKEYTLREDETTDSLLKELNKLGGRLVTQVIQNYLAETAQPVPQDDSKATLTKFIKKEDGYFEIDNPPDPEKLDRMIRAYYPWPNVWTKWNNKQSFSASKVVKLYPGGLVQMEGKKAVKLEDFLNGHPDFPLKQLQQE